MPLLALALLVLLPLFLSMAAPDIDATTAAQKSQALKQQLAVKQAELKQKTGQLNALQRQLNQLAEQQNAIEVRLAELEVEIIQAEQEIAKSQADLDAVRGQLEARLVGLYKQDSSSSWPYVEMIISEGDLTSALQQLDALSQIADEDQKLFDQVESYLEIQRENKLVLEQKQQEQTTSLEQLGQMEETASQSFSSVNAEYRSLRSQVIQLKGEIQKADAAAAAAAEAARQRAIARMAYKRASGWNNSGGGTIQTPPFTFPVQGPHSYINSWGFARSGGRTHKGTDIMAARNTPLVACVTGVVNRVNRTNTGLGGITIHLQGNNGYVYYYAHLDHIAPGIQTGSAVKEGTLIGYVGNSGNARRGACHLHFGVEPGGGSAVNPYATLSFFDN